MSRIAAVVLVAATAVAARGQSVLFDSKGFEAPNYALGPLSGQNTWRIQKPDIDSYVVQSALAAAGTRAVRVSGGRGTQTEEATNWAFPTTPLFTPTGNLGVRIQADLARGTPATATQSFGYSIDVYDSAGDRTTRFGLENSGGAIRPFVTARYNTTTGQFDPTADVVTVPLGPAVPANTFVSFDARLDYTLKSLRLSVNGVDVGADIPFADLTAADFAQGNFQVASAAGAADVGYLDNFVLSTVPVPEPAAGGLAAALLLAVWGRRRAHGRPAAA